MKLEIYDKRIIPYFLVLVLLLIICYYDIFYNMSLQWLDDPNYSHGFLVPVLSIYYVWQNRNQLKDIELKPSAYGLLLVCFAVFVLIAGVSAQELYTKRSSFIVLLAGIVLFLMGWKFLKKNLLPICFLFFMVPLPYIIYDSIAFPLKLFVAKFSVITLKNLGVVVLREGNIILFPHTVLEVADACSGLRSIMSLLALGVALAVFSQKNKIPMVILILSSIPIAILTNMIRVIGTGFLAQYYGAAAAEGFFHEFAGMGVFLLAMFMLFILSGVLRKVCS